MNYVLVVGKYTQVIKIRKHFNNQDAFSDTVGKFRFLYLKKKKEQYLIKRKQAYSILGVKI